MAYNMIKNKVTGGVVMKGITEVLHIRNFLVERLQGDDVFEMAEGDEECGAPIAVMMSKDNYDAMDIPRAIGMFYGNLEDADLLIHRINDFPFNDYVVSRKQV